MIGRFFLCLAEITSGAALTAYIMDIGSREVVLWSFLILVTIVHLTDREKKFHVDLLFWGIGVFSITAYEGLKVVLAVWLSVRILGLGNRIALPVSLVSLPVFASFFYPDDLALIITTLGLVIINRHLFNLQLI